MREVRNLLVELVKTRAPGDGNLWLADLLAKASDLSANQVLNSYTAAPRKVGKEPLRLGDKEKERLTHLDSSLRLDHWTVDDAGRAVLLMSLSHLSREDFIKVVLDCYQLGDAREQQSWLRGLVLLPHGDAFLPTAVDACRTNIIPTFESIACENPYPSRHFPELNFNQMVLKSLFTGIALARIVGLDTRFNSELSRMADDYASEREAAGRPVPADIWLALAPASSAGQRRRVYRYLHQQDPEHRYWAAVGLGYVQDEDAKVELERRKGLESDERVRKAIEFSLSQRASATTGDRR